MSNGDGWFTRAAKIASVPALVVSGLALWNSFNAYRLQKGVADRVWRSQLIVTMFDLEDCPYLPCLPKPKANRRSREEAIRAYLALQREYKQPINLRETVLSEMIFPGEDFSGADLSDAILHSTVFSGANLRDSVFVAADLTNSDLTGATCTNADFTAAILQGAKFSGANLENALLQKANLGVCEEQQFDSATGEPYRSADLKGAKLRGANFEGASLCGANLRGADLTDVKHLTQEQLDQTEGDDTTVIPNHLTRPKSWSEGNPQDGQ